MKISTALDLLMDKGLLSEEDTFTIVRDNETGSVSLQLKHPLIVLFSNAQNLKSFSARLERLYTKDSSVLAIDPIGTILRLSVEEFSNHTMDSDFIFFFDSRKARTQPLHPFSLKQIDDVVGRLLAPGGCPWDRSQDHMSLRTYFLQEVYEVIDAIDKNDIPNLTEELGDVLFQVVIHAKLCEEEGQFSMQDVVDGISEKMIRRHPFVFGNSSSEELDQAFETWEKRKRIEKNRQYLLSGVPRSLPSLLLACIIQKKVSSNGLEEVFFSESFPEDVRRKICDILDAEDQRTGEFSAGAFLFALDRVLCERGIDPELALHSYTVNFMDRLRSFESDLQKSGKTLADMTPEDAQKSWKKFNGNS